MSEYHKIQTIFKRGVDGNPQALRLGDWTKQEFKALRNLDWHWTEKIDGMNIRVIYEDGKIRFAGRTNRANLPGQLVNHLNELFIGKESLIGEIFDGKNCVIYGEGYGGKIQKGSNTYGPEQRFIAFDVMVDGVYWSEMALCSVCGVLGIDSAPLIDICSIDDMIEKCRNGIVSTFGNFEAEGVVGRPPVELLDSRGNRIITKMKCNDFRNAVDVDALSKV
ncbi:MAG: RNA ligase family protein [Victivallaceae bacterium]|nr:RNA ligase family protein [Victivallaceae bacterium]